MMKRKLRMTIMDDEDGDEAAQGTFQHSVEMRAVEGSLKLIGGDLNLRSAKCWQ